MSFITERIEMYMNLVARSAAKPKAKTILKITRFK
jgi:hypothetical protein